MRRELIIAAAVLVPFAVLVAAGFYFSPDPPGVVEQVEQAESPLPPRGEGQGEGRTAVDAAVPAPLPPFPPELQAPLTAVLPEVQRCFADQHLKRAREVKVHFTPTPDGGFTQVTIDNQQDPYLTACLEDVFAEVRFHPDGRQTWQPATHTFSFDPSPD